MAVAAAAEDLLCAMTMTSPLMMPFIREGEMLQRVSTIMLDVFTKIVKIADHVRYGPILG
jgi:uncharacterized membrane protein